LASGGNFTHLSQLVIRKRLLDFRATIHHEWTLADVVDGLMGGCGELTSNTAI
jgi:hypothetical protein